MSRAHTACFAAVVFSIACLAQTLTEMEKRAAVGNSGDAGLPLAADLHPGLGAANVLQAMRKVAAWQWSQLRPNDLNADWTFAALYAGLLEADRLNTDRVYERALASAAQQFQWRPGPRLTHADDHAIGQVYLELYSRFHDPKMIAPLRDQFDQVRALPDDPNKPLWWWCDALFMAPPVWARLAQVTGRPEYLDYMDRQWWITVSKLYDRQEHLFFRDAAYLDKRESNGAKVFWSRGNGWVMGGLARVLESMPAGYSSRERYVTLFREMAERVASIQSEDGLWRPGLLNASGYRLPESSGSAFFVYSLAWGINQNLLDRARYLPVVERGWNGLLKQIRSNGRLGCIQPVGEAPGRFDETSSFVYGVGAFLLAGSEITQLNPVARIAVTNPLDQDRGDEIVELLAPNGIDPRNIVVEQDERMLPVQADGGKLLVLVHSGAKQVLNLSLWYRPNTQPAPALVHGRAVPERKDDFAWENDHIAYRIYGPALEASGEIGSGIDVWLKRVPRLVVDDWYRKDLRESISYHKDHGEGLDSYKVGPTRGCGGTGVWSGERLAASRNYTAARILSSGPIRITFEVTYAPWRAAGSTVSETKRITLDAGSHLNRIDSAFKVEGARGLPVAAGLAIHKGAHLEWGPGASYASVWEPADDPSAGMVATGVLPSPGMNGRAVTAAEDALLVFDLKGGGTLTYYAGAGWSGADMRSQSDWSAYLRNFASRLRHPLRVEWIK